MKDLLWVDIETTGIGPSDAILEIAAIWQVPSTGEAMKFHQLLPWHGDVSKLAPAVQEMHTKNGLFDECRQLPPLTFQDQVKFANWVRDLPERPKKLIMAGSSVHFDKQVLDSRGMLPSDVFSYRLFDVSALRRFYDFIICGPDYTRPESKSTHRALPDIEATLAEFQAIRDDVDYAYDRIDELEEDGCVDL